MGEEMSKEEWDHFVKMLCAEKLKIQQTLGIYQCKNFSIRWVIFSDEYTFDRLDKASELYRGLDKFKENLLFVIDENTINWSLRATIVAE